MPAPQQQGGHPGALGGQLQPPARHRRQGSHLADHRGDAGAMQPFLHCPEDLGLARGPRQHDARGVEAAGGETWPVDIRPGEAPQHDAVFCAIVGRDKPAENMGGKGGGECAILLVAADAEDLVHRTQREPAAG